MIHLHFLITLIVLCTVQMIYTEKVQKQEQPWLPKIVWTIWDGKIPQNEHVLKMFEHNRKPMTTGWQVRHVDNDNLQYWLSQIPDAKDAQLIKQQYFRYTEHQKKSDLLRMLVLKHFGGAYIDYTIALTQHLDWLANIYQSPMVQNKFGKKPQAVIMRNTFHGSQETAYDDQTKQKILVKPAYQNFFIAAKPHAKYIQQWVDMFIEMRKQSYKRFGNDTYNTHALTVAKQQNITIGWFLKGYFQQSISAQIVLQRKQRQFDKQWQKDQKKPRKFAVKYYNVWPIDAGKTAYGIHQPVAYKGYQIIQKFFQIDRKILQKQNVGTKYFIKIYNDNRILLDKFFLTQNSIKEVLCPNNNYILESSYFYQYLLKDYPIKFYTNEIVKRVQDNTCWNFNQYTLNSEQAKNLNQKVSQLTSKQQENKKVISQLKQEIRASQAITKNNQFFETSAIIVIVILSSIIILCGLKNREMMKRLSLDQASNFIEPEINKCLNNQN